MASSLEAIRLRNIADNKRILAELGVVNAFKPVARAFRKYQQVKRQPETKPRKPKKKRTAPQAAAEENGSDVSSGLRRSSRIRRQPAEFVPESGSEASEDSDEDYSLPRKSVSWRMRVKPQPVKVPPNRPNVYGAIPGVEVGEWWGTRLECCAAGVHRPTVAGIHGKEEGVYSIALSGGYEDDVDLGECFTYTGEGGRDLKGTKNAPKNLRTAPQSKDQTLTRGNLALKVSSETGRPVRVIRGYKLRSQYAPEEGYRYDGLYTVEKAWFTDGMAGFGVWKFAMKRCEKQAPPPWYIAAEEEEEEARQGDLQPSPTASPAKKKKKRTEDDNSDQEKQSDPRPSPHASPAKKKKRAEDDNSDKENVDTTAKNDPDTTVPYSEDPSA